MRQQRQSQSGERCRPREGRSRSGEGSAGELTMVHPVLRTPDGFLEVSVLDVELD